MKSRKPLRDPFFYRQKAIELEQAGHSASAERSFKEAIRKADLLPLTDYGRALTEIESRAAKCEAVEKNLELEALAGAYQELMATPFRMRLELVAFHIRKDEPAQALNVLNEALTIGPAKELEKTKNRGLCDLVRRARELQLELKAIEGPPKPIELMEELFERIDTNNDGFLHKNELKAAMLDLTIDSKGQELIRYLMHHYEEMIKASADEFFWDWKGISKEDLRVFEKDKHEQ